MRGFRVEPLGQSSPHEGAVGVILQSDCASPLFRVTLEPLDTVSATAMAMNVAKGAFNTQPSTLNTRP